MSEVLPNKALHLAVGAPANDADAPPPAGQRQCYPHPGAPSEGGEKKEGTHVR